MAHTADFLVEIGTEELPPKALRALEGSFAEHLRTGLTTAGLGFATLRSYATPRRLAVSITALDREQPRQRVEKRGPPLTVAFDADGKPSRATQAFAAARLACSSASGSTTCSPTTQWPGSMACRPPAARPRARSPPAPIAGAYRNYRCTT